MPRAERRKRDKDKLLIESAKKIPKLTSFFKCKSSVSAESDVGVELESGIIGEPRLKPTASATDITLPESKIC